MAAAQYTVGLTAQWTPPNAAVNSGNASLAVQGTYNAQQVGQIDVQTSATPGDTFNVQFGSIAAAKLVIIKNMMSSDIGIRINGSVTDNFKLASGGEFVYAAPAAPSSSPLASLVVAITAAPTAVEQINTFVFGD